MLNLEFIKNAGMVVKETVTKIDMKRAGQVIAGVAGVAGAALLTVAGTKAVQKNDTEYTQLPGEEDETEETAEPAVEEPAAEKKDGE